MRRLRDKALSEPWFGLNSKPFIQKVADILAHARQPRISIHYEDLSLEGPDRQVQKLNLLLSPTGLLTHGQHGGDTPPTMPPDTMALDRQAEREQFLVEGQEAESFIYPVASFGKTFIALTWIILLKDPKFRKEHRVKLKTRACVLYNERRDKDTSSEILLPGNPSILDLLDHVKGFAAMNKYLMAPDGTPLFSENEEFLRVACKLTHDKYSGSQESGFEYSNANYIFLGILLELLTGEPLWSLVERIIIDKLGLTETTFNIDTLGDRQKLLVDGFRVSADGTQSVVDGSNHLGALVQYASLGLRSSQRDLATFNRELLLALDGESRLGLEEADLNTLFKGEPMAPYGYFSKLGEVTYSESPNSYLFPKQYTPYDLGRPRAQGEGKDFAFRKAGYIDGFSCNVTLMPRRRISLIVLGNATGPIDTTFHISNLVLQEALRLSPSVDIVKSAIEEGRLCCATLAQIEDPEDLKHASSQLAGDLAGIYEHERYEQGITIHEDGTIQLHTRTRTSSRMSLVHIGADLLMIRPGKQAFSFETWSSWRELRFQIRRSEDGLALTQPDETYAYKKYASGDMQ